MDRDDIITFRLAHSHVWRVLGLLGRTKGATRTARGALILCPAHTERSASCHVYNGPDGTIAVRCHACGFSGDVLHLFGAVHGLDARRDLRRILEIGGALPPPPAYSPPPRPPSVSNEMFDRLASVLLDACALDGGVARYLAGRGVLDEARSAGWRALPEPIAEQQRLVGRMCDAVGVDAFRASGLASKDGRGFAFPRHLLVIPYRSTGADPVVCTLQRRRLDAGEPKYVFPTARAVPPWPFGSEVLENIGENTVLVFAEGAIDALTLRARYGAQGLDRAVLAIPSASTWRDAWAGLATGRDVLVATDADDAGEAVAERMVADLFAAGARSVSRATPEHGKDWNSEVAA